jgi:hypothetical protein
MGAVGWMMKIVSERAGGLPSATQRAKAAGLALTVADLRRKVPPDRDALPAVLRAGQHLALLPDAGETYRLGETVLSFEATPEQKARMVDAAHRAEPVLRALREAAQYPDMSVPEPEIRFDPRPQPPSDILNFGVLLFSAEALLAGERGDLEAAQRALDLGRGLLPLMEAEKTYPTFRARCWSEIRLQRALVRVVQANIDRPEAVEMLRHFQQKLGPLPSVRTALAGDLALSLDAISRRKEEDVEQLPLADAFKDMGRADVVAIFTRAVERMPEDPADLAKVDTVLTQMEEEADDAPIYGGYAKGYRTILQSLKDVMTRRRLAQTVLAMIDQIRQGEIPGEIPDLGANRIDPHNGESFRLKQRNNRLVVYSVGRDGLDDDGREHPPLRLKVQTRDVVFAVPLSPNERAR